ncbi:hypothetical protein [Micromonospora sp. IBHARD004]
MKLLLRPAGVADSNFVVNRPGRGGVGGPVGGEGAEQEEGRGEGRPLAQP